MEQNLYALIYPHRQTVCDMFSLTHTIHAYHKQIHNADKLVIGNSNRCMPDKEKKRYSVKEKENHIFAFSSNNMTVNRGEYYRQSHNLN